jgi:hypothetical protein
MHQQTKSGSAVKIITDPVGSNIFRAVARRFGDEIRQQDGNIAF